MEKAVTAIVIGAGCRGSGYSQYAQAFPNQLQIVGVAEPREFYRKRLQEKYDIPKSNVFKDWTEITKRDKMSDCVMICTPDRLHKDPAIACAKKGYNILLEKPMSVTEADCRDIVKACKESGVILSVCHVLRYTPWAQKLKEIIDSGAIGDVVNIQHLEPVGFWHFAHSYVRGNWHKESKSSNSLLAKCCHDVDLINFWMGGKKCKSISSFGHLSHFNKASKPKGAASRCLDCPSAIEQKCPYSAKKIYMGGNTGWPVSVITEEPDVESITKALKNGPYGKCVYDCDNDVMSNQVVNMQFDDNSTASLTMMAFTKRLCVREVQIFGTMGQLTCIADHKPTIKHHNFVTEETKTIDASPESSSVLSGHGGADFYCMKTFINALQSGTQSCVISGPDETLNSHLLVFAAEKARKENRVVSINEDGTF